MRKKCSGGHNPQSCSGGYYPSAKRILGLFLAFTLLLSLMPIVANAEYGTQYGDLYYIVNDDNTVSITDCDQNVASVVIPSEIDGLPVTIIGRYAFQDCTSLTSIDIPNSITKIESDAFYGCASLTSINVNENNMTYSDIDGVLFKKDKTELTCYPAGKSNNSYTIPNSVTRIGNDAFWKCKSLTSINIPNSVTSIGSTGFYNCASLTSIDIPNSVTNIGVYAFSWCSSLTSITIPNSVTSIGDSAFYKTAYYNNENNWENDVLYIDNALIDTQSKQLSNNYTIKKGTTIIAYGAFDNCTNLTSITIPNGVTSIGEFAFKCCESLTNINIPNSVTNIGVGAFYVCGRLTDVYYNGSKAEWEAIETRSGNDDLLNATIHYNSSGIPMETPPPTATPAPIPTNNPTYSFPEYLGGTVKFATGKGSAIFAYDDKYFTNSSYTYNHDLARMSLRFAMSAFAKKGSGDNKYKTQYINAENLLKDMKYDNIYHNDCYEQEPTADSIGVIIADKKIAFEDGDYTVIAVGIRGGNYESEWGGNFKVGNGDFHEGFETARDRVIKEIKSYIANEGNKISGKIKIWITGFSRAGATANLTAGYLDGNLSCLGDNVTLDTDDIYAYCFEPPAGVRTSAGIYNNIYTNIFNIVNENDPVPKVVMDSWGYARYGVDKYLPLMNVPNKSAYDALKNKMLKKYSEYKGGDYLIDDFYKLSYTNLGVWYEKKINEGIFFDDLLEDMGDMIGSPAKYQANYQEALAYLGTEIMGKKNIDDFMAVFKKNAMKKSSVLLAKGVSSNTVYSTLKSVITSTFKDLGCEIKSGVIDSLAVLFGEICISGKLSTLLENKAALFQGHYPELCLAWMDAINEADLSSAPMRRVCINCPVDIEVYDKNGERVALIADNEVDESSILPADVTESGEKHVYLPANCEYKIKVTATDNGSVSYSVKEMQEDGNVKVVSYSGISVNAGSVLNGTAENLEETEGVYAIEADGAIINPEVSTTEAVPVSVSISAKGGGTVVGGGTAYTGESVKAMAVPYDGESFIGWYSGDELVSTETEYDILAVKDMELIAVFTENTCEVAVSDGESIISVQRINKGETVTLDENLRRERGIFNGYYADENFNVKFNESTVFSSDSIIYAKFNYALKSGDWYYFMKDDGTAAIAGCDNIDEALRIPNKINGYTVTSLWYAAFNAEEKISTVIIPDTVSFVEEDVFANCDGIVKVYYTGSRSQWDKIVFEDGNEVIKTAEIITNFKSNTGNGGSYHDNSGLSTTSSDVAAPTATPAGEQPTTAPVETSVFTDVPASHWAYSYIMDLYEDGIVNGVSATQFMPDANVTRAEFTKMAAGIFGLTATSATSQFVDVPAGEWYAQSVIAATEAGIVQGISDTEFGPEENITREQMATIIGRQLGMTSSAALTYTDSASIEAYAVPYVVALTEAGYLTGDNGQFNPKANATRAEAATLLDRVYAVYRL